MSVLVRMLALLPLLSSGCFAFALKEALDEDPKRDGESCDGDGDCESESCRGGMCTASSCDSSAQCEAGFVCDEPSDWAEGWSLGTAKGACVPTCDRCPFRVEPRWVCGGETCGYDASPWVDAGGPYDGIAGDPIEVHATVELDGGRELASAEWWFQGTVVATGLDAEITIEMPGTHSLELIVADDAPLGASATATITVCGEAGTTCWSAADCCEGLTCGTDGTCE
jgi:hypothetical protein